jgi:hypothetical protein
MGQMKNYRELIKELPSNQVICTFGEFHPPSAAHELQVKAVKKLAEEYRSDHLVLVSSSLKEDFLPTEKRVQYMNLMFPGTTIKVTGKSIEESLKELSRRYKSVVLVISEDLTENFQKILRKANLPLVEIILAGNTDPDSNKLCESAKKGDYTKFKKGLPSSLRELDSRRLMNDIRLNMGLEMVREEVKFSVNDLRDKYFRGEIYHIGEIVESDSNVYQIIKRGSNHLLLQSEGGVKVSKWIQDVKTSTREFMLKEGVMQPCGTDQVISTATTPVVPVNGIKFKDFKNLLNKNKKPEIDLDNLDDGVDRENSVDRYADAAAQALSRAEPDRAGGLMHEPTSSVDNRHRRIKYHLGEDLAYHVREAAGEFKIEVEPKRPNIKLRSGAVKIHDKAVKIDTEEGWENSKNIKEKLSEEDIDAMVELIQDEYDIIAAYDDSELAIIDEETGEEILDEETIINEVLSRSERMRAKIRFAKTKAKRERSAKLALRRTSSTGTINKRARRLAINLMKKRLLRGRNASSLSVGEKERIEAMVAKRKPILNRLAMKLSPRLRQIEKARLSHHKFTQTTQQNW